MIRWLTATKTVILLSKFWIVLYLVKARPYSSKCPACFNIIFWVYQQKSLIAHITPMASQYLAIRKDLEYPWEIWNLSPRQPTDNQWTQGGNPSGYHFMFSNVYNMEQFWKDYGCPFHNLSPSRPGWIMDKWWN